MNPRIGILPRFSDPDRNVVPGSKPRFHIHFTPTSASWLNQVERFFAALTEKQIRRGSFRSTQQLEAAIRHYLDHHNAQPKPFRWTKSADDILNALAKYCE